MGVPSYALGQLPFPYAALCFTAGIVCVTLAWICAGWVDLIASVEWAGPAADLSHFDAQS